MNDMESPNASAKYPRIAGDSSNKPKRVGRKPDMQMYVPRAKRLENAARQRPVATDDLACLSIGVSSSSTSPEEEEHSKSSTPCSSRSSSHSSRSRREIKGAKATEPPALDVGNPVNPKTTKVYTGPPRHPPVPIPANKPPPPQPQPNKLPSQVILELLQQTGLDKKAKMREPEKLEKTEEEKDVVKDCENVTESCVSSNETAQTNKCSNIPVPDKGQFNSCAIPAKLKTEGDSILDCLPRSYDEFESKELHLRLERQLSSPLTSPIAEQTIDLSPPPDDEDLEVQRINESFEETQKQTEILQSDRLKKIFDAMPNQNQLVPKPKHRVPVTVVTKPGVTWAGWGQKRKESPPKIGGDSGNATPTDNSASGVSLASMDSGHSSLIGQSNKETGDETATEQLCVEMAEKVLDQEEKIVKTGNQICQETADNWEDLCNDVTGEIDAKIMKEINMALGQVKVETPKFDYLQFKPKEVEFDEDECGHVLEVYGFPLDTKTEQLTKALAQLYCEKVTIKWVDDDHTLATFQDKSSALEALQCTHPLIKLRPLSQATPQSKQKAKLFKDLLLPYMERPRTSAVLARRMIEGHLGKKSSLPTELRKEQRTQLKEAKYYKETVNKQRENAWDGTL